MSINWFSVLKDDVADFIPITLLRKFKILEPLPEPNADSLQGWLSPDGLLYGCKAEGHNQIEYALEQKLNIQIDSLEKLGWIKLGTYPTNFSKPHWHLFDKPSKKQELFILQWCDKYDQDLPDELKEENYFDI